jgi:predicted RNA-binding protein YlqC (UPF0109 family)
MKNLIETIAKSICDYPDKVVVTEVPGQSASIIEVCVDKSDLGKMIGKSGHTAQSIRNIIYASSFKFKKIPLQPDTLPLLEYWSIESENVSRDVVVLTEGIFNSIGEYVTDSLGLKDKVRSYASGNTFSYSELLKSVCYDLSLYKANVIILSDNDKKKKDYHWFLKNNSHIIKTCKIYINKSGKDFGIFPQVPVELL